MITSVTEEDLLKNFEQYQKLVDKLGSLYLDLPAELPGESEVPNYVAEANFSYQVHASI